MKKIVLDIISKSEFAEIFVDLVCVDMGPNNVSMLNQFGISVQKVGNNWKVTNKIKHPVDPDRFLYFFYDVPHMEKNLATGWRTYQTIEMSRELKSKYKFPVKSVIDISQVRIIFKIYRAYAFKFQSDQSKVERF